MKACKHKPGVTLVEMLIVVAIIALLATMVISMAARIGHQAKEQLTENTIAILTAALGQFQDYGYSYKDSDYADFDFPLDCNGFEYDRLENTLGDALGAGSVSISPIGAHDPNYSGSEALYFFLSRVPASRETLDKIDNSLITNMGSNKQDMTITVTVDGKKYPYPLLRIVDPWRERGATNNIGKTLRYDYYDETAVPPDPDEKRNFPVITSAGPDGKFGTGDDITSR